MLLFIFVVPVLFHAMVIGHSSLTLGVIEVSRDSFLIIFHFSPPCCLFCHSAAPPPWGRGVMGRIYTPVPHRCSRICLALFLSLLKTIDYISSGNFSLMKNTYNGTAGTQISYSCKQIWVEQYLLGM